MNEVHPPCVDDFVNGFTYDSSALIEITEFKPLLSGSDKTGSTEKGLFYTAKKCISLTVLFSATKHKNIG